MALLGLIAHRRYKESPESLAVRSPNVSRQNPLGIASVAALSPTGRLADEELSAKLTFDRVSEDSRLVDEVVKDSSTPRIE